MAARPALVRVSMTRGVQRNRMSSEVSNAVGQFMWVSPVDSVAWPPCLSKEAGPIDQDLDARQVLRRSSKEDREGAPRLALTCDTIEAARFESRVSGDQDADY